MRFGVLGTAAIGIDRVIPAVQASEHQVVAIASREGSRAESVAAETGIHRSVEGYEALLDADGIDAVYIPLPNGLHAEWIRRAADAGLHVLCEKPLTASAAETAAVFDYCEERGVTLMEAFMYRFHPRTERVSEVVNEELGAVTSVTTTSTYPVEQESDDVRLDADLAGGSLMDVGCYGVGTIRGLLGEPDRVYASSVDSRGSGVDTRLVGVLEYDSGAAATLVSGFDCPDTQTYRVQTTDGWLSAERAYWVGADEPVEVTYAVDGRSTTERFDPVDDYRREVEHFAECVRTGETPRVDRNESIGVIRVVDALYRSADEGSPVALT